MACDRERVTLTHLGMSAEPFADVWGQSTGTEFIRAIAEGRVPQMPHAVDVGLRVVDVSPGRIELAWRPPVRLTNPAGIVHGGYIAIALDDAAGLSCVSMAERFRPMLTMDLRIDFIRPAMPDVTYRALGEVVHPGKTRMLADARLVAPDGKIVARASGAFTTNKAYDPTRDPRVAAT
jgi:uncharacterized protein (TIGR00369 family)